MVGPDAQVFFASDHCFTAATFVLRINTLLEEKGYLAWADNDGSEMAKRREASDFANLDWSKTTACCLTPSSNGINIRVAEKPGDPGIDPKDYERSEEHTSELQSLMRISYAVFCLKKKNTHKIASMYNDTHI